MIGFKKGVDYKIDGAVKILMIANDVYKSLGEDCIVTSLMEGKHMKGSKHYIGNAVDFRTRTLNNAQKRIAKKLLAEGLGRDYDVVLEATHFHVEYDPKD